MNTVAVIGGRWGEVVVSGRKVETIDSKFG